MPRLIRDKMTLQIMQQNRKTVLRPKSVSVISSERVFMGSRVRLPTATPSRIIRKFRSYVISCI
jgi:hypothetical protein